MENPTKIENIQIDGKNYFIYQTYNGYLYVYVKEIEKPKEIEAPNEDYEIKITSNYNDLENLMWSLLLNNYEITVKTFYKEYPYDNTIDYFLVKYRVNNERE